MTFWVLRLLRLGNQRPLQSDDIDDIRKYDSVDYQKQKLRKYLEKYVYKSKGDKKGLLKAMYHRFVMHISVLALVGSLASIMDYSGAVFIKLLESFLFDEQPY